MLICAGSGGVGKTTLSAAMAIRGAQLGRRVFVLTIDPARRLATSLGLRMDQDNEAVVQGDFSGTVTAAMVDSRRTFDRFITRHAGSNEIVQRLLRNRLYQQLSTNLSGSQEFTALERLLEAIESQKYDLVILDTPPTKHAVDFLTAPERISALFHESVTKWFAAEGSGQGLWAGLVSRGTRTVLKSLETLTGSSFIEALSDFFMSLQSLQVVLRERSVLIEKMLKGPDCSFVVVTSLDAAKLEEAQYLQMQLQEMQYTLQAVIVNRAYPMWLRPDVQLPELADETYQKVQAYWQQFQSYYGEREQLYEDFSQKLEAQLGLIRIPEYNQDIAGLEDLQKLARQLAFSS